MWENMKKIVEMVIISLFSKSISLDFKWGNIWRRVLFSDY